MDQTKREIRAQRVRTNYAKMMDAGGAPGWSRQRRSRFLLAVGLLLGFAALAAGVLALVDASWKPAFAYAGLGLIVLALAWPLTRRPRQVERVLHDGAPALAGPAAPLPRQPGRPGSPGSDHLTRRPPL